MTKQTKVGIFLLAGIVCLGVLVFMIGDTRQTWARKVPYVAAFKDVAGLKPGAPVELGGVDIGLVTKVGYGAQSNDARIYVEVDIKKAEAVRIRVGTKASVAMKGMLGDKMLILKVKDPGAPAIPPGGRLETDEGDDIVANLQAAVERSPIASTRSAR